MDHPSSFTDIQRPSGAAPSPSLKDLILNEPGIVVSKLRDLDASNSKSERFAFFYQLTELFSPDHSDELSAMCWNILLEAGLPQLIIEIVCKELKNTESVSNIRA